MENTRAEERATGKGRDVFYVRGSGWLPIPESRLNEIPVVIREYHDRSARDAMPYLQLYRRA